MKTLVLFSQVVINSLGLKFSSPALRFFPQTKNSGGAQHMGSYTLNNSISIFFGATYNQVTINN